ncbi:MAG: hypothetical protein ACREON_07265 [Gemmatimonadaceae bacterium]
MGIVVALVMLRPARLVSKAHAAPERGFARVLANTYYVDEAYGAAIVEPTVSVSRGVLWRFVDAGVIDGALVNGSAAVARGFAWVGSRLQSGQVGTYAWAIVVGVVVVVGAFTLR